MNGFVAVDVIDNTPITEVVIVPPEVFDAFEDHLGVTGRYTHVKLDRAGVTNLLRGSIPVIRGGAVPPQPNTIRARRESRKGLT